MNIKERANLVRAMETITRTINDEEVFKHWLLFGVAYGDINDTIKDEELIDYYENDLHFAMLMEDFLTCMYLAKRSGGLYCDGVCSKYDSGTDDDEEEDDYENT